jgi:hypothetical protein
MPDNWGFVAAAYGLTAAVLGLYWRHLVRKEKELRRSEIAGSTRNLAVTASLDRETAERSRQPSSAGHPRPDPTARGPLQQ